MLGCSPPLRDGQGDTRVFNDVINKYGDKFPHLPQGKKACCIQVQKLFLCGNVVVKSAFAVLHILAGNSAAVDEK
jgi:hypothetical protein